MARRVSAADTSMTGPPLPTDCYQYLNLLETIEKFSNAPNLLDQNLWQILCKMRRAKIEVELKVTSLFKYYTNSVLNIVSLLKIQLRSYGEQIAEAESTVNAYSREISLRKSKLVQCDKKLEDLKEQQVDFIGFSLSRMTIRLHVLNKLITSIEHNCIHTFFYIIKYIRLTIID